MCTDIETGLGIMFGIIGFSVGLFLIFWIMSKLK